MDDVLIIGSGFGGAMAALTLAQSGARVRLLERGPWRDTLPLQQSTINRRAPLPQGRHFLSHALYRLHHRWLPGGSLSLHRHGLLELFAGPAIRAVCTSAVGGGSHAYGGLNARPLHHDYWDKVADGLSSAQMEPYYQTALALMNASQPDARHFPPLPPLLPADNNPFVDVDGQQQPAWAYLFGERHGHSRQRNWRGFARHEAVFEQEGPFGSPGGGKTTLDIACLLPAIQLGLQLQANCEVLAIRRINNGYAISARDSTTGRLQDYRAAKVVVAAGTLNTVRLLLNSRAQGGIDGMPALGQGFTANADTMAWWPVNTRGANHPAHGIYQRLLRHRDDHNGPLLLQTGIAGLHAMPLPGWLKKRLQQDLFIAAMGVDEASGRLSLKGSGLHMDYDSRQPVYRRIDQHLQTIADLSGIKPRKGKTPTTVHPMGGAVAGSDPQQAVINASGEVFGQPGLFVADGSALPAATGSPPSMSIAAWALHVAAGISQRG